MPSHGDLVKSSDSFVSSPTIKPLARSSGSQDSMSLHVAAAKGDCKTLDTLFRKGADINEYVADGSTALHIASYYGHAICVKFLLSHAARTDLKDKNGNMPIHLAVKKNHLAVVEALINYDANLEARGASGLCPVHTAAKYGYDKVLLCLLENGARADRYTDTENSQHALHLAASRGQANAVKLLLEHNENFTEPRDSLGRTPLYIAVLKNRPSVVLVLSLSKAQANAADNAGKIPLQVAIDEGYDDVCHTLCEHGADVSLRYSTPRKDIVQQLNFDRYGQIKMRGSDDIIGDITKIGAQAKALQLELSRAKQWERMIKHWNKYMHYKKEKVRKRIARGIPDCVRSQVWKLLCGFAGPVESSEFRALRAQESVWAHQIDLDVGRAFRNHVTYHTRFGKGQCSLFHVLKAYSNHDTELGYCQGMGDVAGLLLKYYSDRDAFSIYDILMRESKYGMRGCFLNDFPKLQKTFYVHGKLLECISPRLASHLRRMGAVTPLYATRWYLTVFLDIFPFDMTLRIWDLFFMDGFDILYSVSMAILKIHEDELLNMQFDGVMGFMHGLGERHIDIDDFVSYVIEHRISTRNIRRLEQAYEEYGDTEGVHTMHVNK